MVATNLASGQAAIIGYNTGQSLSSPSSEDKLSFVLLAPIGSGTTIYFTDRSWNGTAFNNAAGDGTYAYTAASDLPAGTVISLTQAQLSAAGVDISEAGDTIYVYQGSGPNSPTTFLFAADIADGNSTFNASLVNTGLINGVTAVAIAWDSGAYAGPTTQAESFFWDGAPLIQSITRSINWTGDDADTVNAKEQEYQTGPWLVHSDLTLWATMGGNGLGETQKDSTFQSGNDDFNHTRLYDYQPGFPPTFNDAKDMVFDTVDGKYFVVDSDNTGKMRILQGNISELMANPGGTPTLTVLYQELTNLTIRADSLEVDVANNIIYFTNGSKLIKIAYDTPSQAGTILFDANVTAATSPSGVANPAGSTANFFDDLVINFSTGKAYLSSSTVSSTGADNQTIVKNFIYELSGLTATSATNAFTFNATNTGTARLLPFALNDVAYNPSGPTTHNPSTAQNQAYFLAQELGAIRGLAIDPTSNILYFTTAETKNDLDLNAGTPGTYAGGIIGSYALGGNPSGTIAILYQQTSELGGSIPGKLGDLEIDVQAGQLYVIDTAGDPTSPGSKNIYRIATTGGTPIQFSQTIGDPIHNPSMTGLTLNHAPTISPNSLSASVTEASAALNSGETARVQLFNGLTISDVDTSTPDELTGAVVRISSNFQSGVTHQDYLRIGGNTSGTIAGSGITYSYNSTTGAMVLNGVATVAEYKAAIESVTFSTSGDNVTASGIATTRQVAVSVSDGLSLSDETFSDVSVTGINDAPVNNGMTGTFSGGLFVEGSNGVALSGISVSDADTDAATQSLQVTVSVSTGTLTMSTLTGLTFSSGDGTADDSMTFSGTVNALNAALASLSYKPVADFNGNATLTLVTNDIGNNGNDPGLTGTGTSEEDNDAKTINISAANDAPVVAGDGTESAPAILEDTPLTNATAPTVSSLLSGQFSDATDNQSVNGGSVANTFAGIAVVANGSSGASGQWQYYNGVAWVDVGSASTSSAKLISANTQLRFNPAPQFNGPAPTLTVHLVDSSFGPVTNGSTASLTGVTGGTSRYSAGTVVLSHDVTSVNDAPTIAGFTGDFQNFFEGSGPIQIDISGNNVVTDADSANFDGGSLTVSISAGEPTEDILGVAPVGLITTQPIVVGNTVSYNGVILGTYTSNGQNGDPLTIAFSNNASNVAVRALIAALTYYNNDQDPTSGSLSVDLVLDDGDGTANGGDSTGAATGIITIFPSNDAPSGVDNSDTIGDGGVLTFTASDFATGFSDVEGNAFSAVKITTLPFAEAGAIRLNGVAISAGDIITAAQLSAGQLTFQPAIGSGGSTPSFTFQVQDNGGTANGGQNTDQTPNTFTINITVDNIAPTLDLDANDSRSVGTGYANAYTEGGSAASIADVDTDIVDANAGDDVVSAIITITNAETGDRLNVGTLPSAVTVDGTSTDTVVKLTAAPGTSAADFEAAIKAITYSNIGNDPTAGDSNTSRSISIVVNDGLANSNTAIATIGVTGVNDAPVNSLGGTIGTGEDAIQAWLSGMSIADPDANASSDDLLYTFDVTNGSLLIRTDVAGGITVGDIVAQDADTITVQATMNQINATLSDSNGLTYTPEANFFGNDTLTVTTNDLGSTGLDAGLSGDASSEEDVDTRTISVSAVNDPVTTSAPATASLNEDSVNFAISGLSISDADSALSPAGVYDVTLSSTNGTMTLTTTTGLTFSMGNGLGNSTITFHGTLADINSALATARYTPTANFNGPAQITLQATDTFGGVVTTGTGAATSDTDTIAVTVNSVAEPLTLGNRIFVDANQNGAFDSGESGINGVSVTLFSDSNGNGTFDSGTDAQLATTITAGGGLYSFGSLAPGDYIVRIDASNFASGGALAGVVVAPGGNDPDDNVDNDSNGIVSGALGSGGFVVSRAITLTDNGETTIDGTGQFNTNDTLDFGFRSNSAPVAKPDAVNTAENAIGSGNLFADNGSGPDSDADGDPLTISAVNGQGGNVGTQITLASGALLTVNANGTYSYNPNGKFNSLTTSASGASNTSATDTFTYTVSGGNTVTVTVTINGVSSADDVFSGSSGNDTITGTAAGDLFLLQQGGNDTATGLGGDDGFYFGAALNGADVIQGGDGDDDQVALQGNYGGATLNAANFAGVETFALLSGTDTRFGDTANNLYDYNLTTSGSFGRNIIVNMNNLAPGEDVTFDGSAEATGSFTFYGGFGVETLTGGAGNDGFYFGPGRFGAGDTIDGGGGTDNQLGLRGDYFIDWGVPGPGVSPTLNNIQTIALLSDMDPNFTPIGDGDFDYSITFGVGQVVSGESLTVNGGGLGANETMTVFGSQVEGTLRLIGGAADDVLFGGEGNDIIFGGKGADGLAGSNGADTFVYTDANQSTATSTDTIQDFTHAIDRLDFSQIDADPNSGGDQAFTYIGSSAFSGLGAASAAQLRLFQVDASSSLWQVEGDLNGDGNADLVLQLHSDVAPTVGDFLL